MVVVTTTIGEPGGERIAAIDVIGDPARLAALDIAVLPAAE